jgi:pimeloyl-ACP methyl ester carboxylesterase
MSLPVERRMRRWQEQRWVLDNVIRTVGIEWDQPRLAYTLAPCGPEATFDFNLVRQRVTKFSDIAREFAGAATRREAKAAEFERDGRMIAARESYFIAALLWGSAQWPLFEDSPQNTEFNDRKVACYAKFVAHPPHRIERVEIPYGKTSLPGLLHFPPGWSGERVPCVLTLDGMDGFKEMMHPMYGDKLLHRGMASLAIDGPGQGEALARGIKVTADNFKDAGRASIDWLRKHPGIAGDQLTVYGLSFGSFWGTQVAMLDEQLAGAAVAFVCHEPGGHTIFNMASPTFKLRFMYMAGIEDEAEFDRFAEDLTLDGRDVRCPLLIVASEDDELSPIEHTYRLFNDVQTPKELVVYQGERHAIGGSAGGLGPNWLTLAADWLRDRVDGRAMASQRVYVDVTGRRSATSLTRSDLR